MGQQASWLWWIPALPFLGSLVAGVLHFLVLRERSSDPSASPRAGSPRLVAVAAIGASFAFSLAAFLVLRGSSATALVSGAWQWIDAGSVQIDVAMVVDRLSSVMILVITGVGFLIHVYSLGYMKKDPGFAKFFAYLNLFVAMMLVLVLSSNLLGLFVGWEGVGLCSYLLIGFWYQKGWPAEAAQKAFVVNRIGDACFLVESFLCVKLFGSLDLAHIAEGGARLAADPATVGTSPSRRSCSSAERAGSRRRSRSSLGSPTRWPVRRPSRPSSMPRRWSRPACTSSCASIRSSPPAPRCSSSSERSAHSPLSSPARRPSCSAISRRCSRTRR